MRGSGEKGGIEGEKSGEEAGNMLDGRVRIATRIPLRRSELIEKKRTKAGAMLKSSPQKKKKGKAVI